MYCRNCGKENTSDSEFCMSCGARPAAGTAFCPACASPTTLISEICVKCGNRLAISHPVSNAVTNRKSKAVSILLAVFLGFWTWLYTYKKDGWKFWTGLGVSSGINIVFFIITISSMLQLTNNRGFKSEVSDWPIILFFIAYIFTMLAYTAIWVWGVVDTAIKKNEWYENYPDVK
jgi:hypothetical protein